MICKLGLMKTSFLIEMTFFVVGSMYFGILPFFKGQTTIHAMYFWQKFLFKNGETSPLPKTFSWMNFEHRLIT